MWETKAKIKEKKDTKIKMLKGKERKKERKEERKKELMKKKEAIRRLSKMEKYS